jgi:hypothetical protein
MKTVLFLIFLSIVVSGCYSSTIVTPSGERGDLSFDQFSKRIQSDEVRIMFHDSSTAVGKGFHIDRDSASWVTAERGILFNVPATQIHAITISPNRLIGGMIGFGVGVAAGALIGAAIGSGAPPGEDHGLAVFIGTVAGAASGALIGTIVGVALPHTNTFHIRDAETER